MDKVQKVYSTIEEILKVIVFIFLALMVVNIFGNVLLRYVFRYPIAWTEELARYLMIWFGFIGMSLALKYDEHVYISFVTKLFPKKVERFLIFLSRIVMLIFLIAVLIYSIKVIPVLSRQKSTALQVPMYIPYLSVTFGSALMILHVFYLFLFGVESKE